MHSKITVYLLSCDRPGLIPAAIESILAQTYRDFELIVTDNSVTNEVDLLLGARYPNVRRIRRNPRLSAINHFCAVLSEVASEYLVMFHDDDVMHPSYLERMVDHIEANPSLAALACNAWFLTDGEDTKRRFMKQESPIVRLEGADAMASQYLEVLSDCAPFPSYLYRVAKTKGVLMDYREGGKFCDVAFLTKLAARNPIEWLAEPLMWYRLHATNDNAIEVIAHRLLLLRFIYKNTSFHRHSEKVERFRLKYWTRWLLRPRSWPECWWRSHRVWAAAWFVATRGTQLLLTKPALWQKFLSRKVFLVND